MIQAVVDEALGPILGWESELESADERVTDLLGFAYPRILDYEATHRAALHMALDQWARRQAGTIGTEERVVRGNRRGLLKKALAPLERRLPRQTFDKAAQSLSLIFGIEAIVVLKDIWGLDDNEARRVAVWAARALVQTAIAESAESNNSSKPKKKRHQDRDDRPTATNRLSAGKRIGAGNVWEREGKRC